MTLTFALVSGRELNLKILPAADIHGVRSVYDWLTAKAEEQQADLVILPGDLSAGSWDEREQQKEAEVFLSVLRKFCVPTLYLMGNDHFFSFTYEDRLMRPLHGRRLEFGECNFVGYQYSAPFIGSIHEKPEEEIEKDTR